MSYSRLNADNRGSLDEDVPSQDTSLLPQNAEEKVASCKPYLRSPIDTY
jgi:hypothetical protein